MNNNIPTPLSLEDLGLTNKDIAHMAFPFTAPTCCGTPCNLCISCFSEITAFVEEICTEFTDCLCMVILSDMSYICGAYMDGKMFQIGNENIPYNALLHEVVESLPEIVNFIIMQNISCNEDGTLEFCLIEK